MLRQMAVLQYLVKYVWEGDCFFFYTFKSVLILGDLSMCFAWPNFLERVCLCLLSWAEKE